MHSRPRPHRTSHSVLTSTGKATKATQPRPKRTLWFEIQPRPFELPKRKKCYVGVVGSFTIREYRHRSRLWPYGLRMSTEIDAREDVQLRVSEAIALASDLNAVWPYVGGLALFHRGLRVIQVKAPRGWRTNARRLRRALPSTRPSLEIRFSRESKRNWAVTLDAMPLEPALRALVAYRSTDAATRLLIVLHAQAMDQYDDAGLFLLAKALEMCRALLPGRTDAQRLRGLPATAQQQMRTSLRWLMEIANSRVNIRHVVAEPNPIKLHPLLTTKERDDYRHDADMIIRALVAQRLGIPLDIPVAGVD